MSKNKKIQLSIPYQENIIEIICLIQLYKDTGQILYVKEVLNLIYPSENISEEYIKIVLDGLNNNK